MRLRSLLPLSLAALPLLSQQASEVPWGLNLPTAQGLEQGALDIRFTHRFDTRARGNSKEAYGLDGYAYAALGFEKNFVSWPGLTFQAYRTADQKTLTLALSQKLILDPTFQVALRVERFDETVKAETITLDSRDFKTGKLGTAIQLPMEWRVSEYLTLSAVPTWLSRSNLKREPLTTVGLSVRMELTPEQAFIAEYYPRPSKLKNELSIEGKPLETAGWAMGYMFKTKGHRFTILGTNVKGTTTNQVLAGDYNFVGPSRSGDWRLGFNIARMF